LEVPDLADPRFFLKRAPTRLGEIAAVIGAPITVDGASERMVEDIAPLSSAGPNDISFLANRRYLGELSGSNAGFVILEPRYADRLSDGMVGIFSDRPYFDFARVAGHFYPEPEPAPGRHPTSVVDPTASVDVSARLDAGVVVEANAKIGPRVWIGANAVIGSGVTVGAGTWIGPSAYLGFCDVGEQCRVHAGVRIGTRGFGFAMDPSGYVDIPQIGRVQVGSFVEIGANSTIDRGMGPDTVLGDGCKIDNLVQIGHNVVLGKGCVIAGQAGVAGSTELKDFVMVGAQAGVAGHLTIGSGAQVAAKAGVIRDLEPSAKVGGLPAVPIRRWLRQNAVIEKLSRDGAKGEDATASEE
jgi:UDP-3-O-[3-hydroxymyristoyl] glucosamine N-acyltransferase